MPLYPIITNFTGGKISHKFEGRTDIKDYYQSCRELTNFIIIPSGGATKAPGSYYVAETKDSSKKSVLVTFEYDIEETYILEVGTDYIRIYNQSDHSYVTEVTNSDPYSEDELFEIQWAQTEDTIYFVHHAHTVKQLSYSGSSWSFSTTSFTGTTFNSTGDYPSAICFYQERMILAATDNNPQTIWGSKNGDYTDFTLGTSASDAFEFLVAMEPKQRIIWVLANRFDIFFGTNLGEWKLTSSSGAAVNPTDMHSVYNSPFGSANFRALLINEDVFFVQRAKRKIRNYIYSNSIQGYQSADLTFKSDDITEGIVRWITLQHEPFTILWAVLENGEIAVLSYERDYGVVAWSKRTTDGDFESITTATKNGEDEIWVIVKRNINGVTKRYIEYFAPFEFGEQVKAHYVDCGKYYDLGDEKTITNATQANPVVITSASHGFNADEHVYINNVEGMTELNDKYYTVKNPTTDTFELYTSDGSSPIDGTSYSVYTTGGYVIRKEKDFSGLSFLEGETVRIYADGAVQPEEIVDSGKISIDYWANKVHVGLGYDSILQPMKIEIPMPLGTSQGRIKRINKITIRFYKTIGCKVGRDEDNLETILFRTGSTAMGEPPPLYTGDKTVTFRGDFEEEGNIYIKSDTATPLTIVSLMPVMGVY